MSLAQEITRAKGGDWNGNQGFIPGPGHSAKDRSMSVRDNDAGDDVILHSFANDDWRACKNEMRADGLLPEHSKARVASAAAGAAYVYPSADGEPVFRVVRKAGKRFIAEHPNGRGGWQSGLADAKPIPYRLPELIAADREAVVFICEGEKDADNLAALGCITTTNPFGAGKWLQGFARYIEGREVFVLADNDKAGRDHADDVCRKIASAARSVAIIALPGLPDKGDVSDWIAAGGTIADLYQLAGNVTPWRDRQPGNDNDAPGQTLEVCDLLPVIDPTSWQGTEPPPRRWIIEHWLARGSAALLTGEGGTGKSLIGQQLATCVATGRFFLGLPVTKAPALYVTCEDDAAELQRRQGAINAMLGIDWHDLDQLALVSLKGETDLALVDFGADGKMRLSDPFHRLERTAKSKRGALIVFDNVAHGFSGNENIRQQVAGFCNALDRLAMAIDGTVLALGHPPKSGSEFSGSTGWDAHVRQRLFLSRPEGDDGEPMDPDARILCRSKSNYARSGEKLAFRWRDWAFTASKDISQDVKNAMGAANAASCDTAFLACLKAATQQRRAVSASRNASNFAPKAFALMTEGKGFKKTQFAAAMERLFSACIIEAGAALWTGKDRKPVIGIALSTGAGGCGAVATNPLETLRAGVCGTEREGYTQPLNNAGGTEREGVSLYTTYISGRAAIGSAPDSEEKEGAARPHPQPFQR